MEESGETFKMNDDLYQNLIARFCGPSTVSAFQIPGNSKPCMMPKTIYQAMSMVGDMFEQLAPYPDMTELLRKPLVFLAGPPGTGKTRTLALVGRKWISDGHVVHIFNMSRNVGPAARHLTKMLEDASASSSSHSQSQVININCNLDSPETTRTTIDNLYTNGRGKPLFGILVELDSAEQKSKAVEDFVYELQKRFRNLHLWAASCTGDSAPHGFTTKFLTEAISCPQAVVREAWKERGPGFLPYSHDEYVFPTDGLPLKYIYHSRKHNGIKEPRDCGFCAKNVATILTDVLRVSGTDEDTDTDGYVTTDQETWRKISTLQYKDIIFLFENDVSEEIQIIKSLKEAGIPVQIINTENQELAFDKSSNTALAMKTGTLCGLKRKVVVYVENAERTETDVAAKWNRLRGITSCTSQLILVRQDQSIEAFIKETAAFSRRLYQLF